MTSIILQCVSVLAFWIPSILVTYFLSLLTGDFTSVIPPPSSSSGILLPEQGASAVPSCPCRLLPLLALKALLLALDPAWSLPGSSSSYSFGAPSSLFPGVHLAFSTPPLLPSKPLRCFTLETATPKSNVFPSASTLLEPMFLK